MPFDTVDSLLWLVNTNYILYPYLELLAFLSSHYANIQTAIDVLYVVIATGYDQGREENSCIS